MNKMEEEKFYCKICNKISKDEDDFVYCSNCNGIACFECGKFIQYQGYEEFICKSCLK